VGLGRGKIRTSNHGKQEQALRAQKIMEISEA